MNALTPSRDLSPAQLATIRRTVARDANDVEFDLFMNMAKSYGLDPFRKQLHLIVYNKDKPEKRSHAIFPSRDGLRVIAQRCGDYRPADEPAKIVCDDEAKDPQTNPLGIISATVKLYKQDKNGDWFGVIGEAYWDEFAQGKEIWAPDETGQRRPTGKMELTPNWRKMGRIMITKCAEGQALRAGWPDIFGGLYLEEELPQEESRVMRDVTPSEVLRQEEIHQRQNRLGNKALMMVFDDTGVLQRVELGKVADRCAEFIEENSPEDVYTWKIRNEHPLREFWAQQPGDALKIKAMVEKKTASVGQVQNAN